jgi:DNA polymerase III epsilon subunit-like protein
MIENYLLYFVDSETSGLCPIKNDVIELSFLRYDPDNIELQEQKTWFMQPINKDNIDAGALRINGYKLEDLLWQTSFGRETFKDPNKVLVEIENWIAEDNCPAENRILVGHNVLFDKNMLEQLWNKCNARETFPFGRRCLDTMMMELTLDLAKGKFAEGYSLNNLVKKYGVVNSKAHTASADTLATKEVFEKQIAMLKKALEK